MAMKTFANRRMKLFSRLVKVRNVLSNLWHGEESKGSGEWVVPLGNF